MGDTDAAPAAPKPETEDTLPHPPADDVQTTETGSNSPEAHATSGTSAEAEQTHDEAANDNSDAGSEFDPHEAMESKDWDDLEHRYHKMVSSMNASESALLQQFYELLTFFEAWQQVSENHEVERTFKRLKTRMFYVQHAEQDLEKKKLHYTQVVEAFENALKLLGQ